MATIGADLNEVRRLEDAALTCWPALSTAFDRSWVIRVSDGQTGRANSVNVLDPADGHDAGPRLRRAAKLFRAHGVVPSLRSTPLTPREVVAAAADLGWSIRGESLVMTRRLPPAEPHRISPARQVSEEWLDAVAHCMEMTPQKRMAIGRKLELLLPPAGFFLKPGPDGRAIAALLAVVYLGRVGIMDVGVDPASRGLGHGRQLVGQALAWAAGEGAALAWLQVDQSNVGAIKLYQRLGFTAAYPYAYHREVPS